MNSKTKQNLAIEARELEVVFEAVAPMIEADEIEKAKQRLLKIAVSVTKMANLIDASKAEVAA